MIILPHSGLKFQPICLYCSITVFCGFILAECSPINSALFTGFQMIAQLSDSSEVHKLHINQSMDLQTPVTVEVEESGVYQVTIFAIKEETGIVGSFVGHVQIVVGDVTSYIIDPTGIPTSTNQHFLSYSLFFLLVVSNTTILPTPTSRRNSLDVPIISKCEYCNLIRYIMNYNMHTCRFRYSIGYIHSGLHCYVWSHNSAVLHDKVTES